ncbi:hypothetical protein [Iningainema tapete]|uniref:Uncharacterized protein n=1 Tax=Iningainema tapete BLCC-T55 TaxID=2748662 RepID=A0A8J6XQ53_9CYAN|nr:hypothetical protein [Iningainema tapete]MBD2777462.1 hypothetical protein [Iningainema tapete BLCC-T55]
MPNWSSIEAGFLKQTRSMQLGELASCLARIKAWCFDTESARQGVPVILSESLFYLSLLIEHEEFNTPEFIQLRQLLLSWQQRWSIIVSQPAEIAFVSATSASWSDRILNMSGLLTEETESV